MTDEYCYHGDQELSAIPINWADRDGSTPRDFSTGWTFTAKVCHIDAKYTVLVAKTAGITGAATYPNITIEWVTADFTSLTKSDLGEVHVVRLYARRTADSKDDVFRTADPIRIRLYTAPA